MEKQYKILQSWFKYVTRIVSNKSKKFGLSSKSGLTEQDKINLKSVGKSVINSYNTISEDVSDLIHDNAYDLCNTVITEVEDETGYVVKDKEDWIESVVASVILGLIYDTKWSLKTALKRERERLEKIITAVIDNGIEHNKSAAEIVEELYQIIDPTRIGQKSIKTKDGVFYISRIDGETQRLVRTTVEHAFQQGIVEIASELEDETGQKVLIRWISALETNTCEVCESRHNQLYEPQDLPLEHPNGQCDFYIEIHSA